MDRMRINHRGKWYNYPEGIRTLDCMKWTWILMLFLFLAHCDLMWILEKERDFGNDSLIQDSLWTSRELETRHDSCSGGQRDHVLK